VQAETHYVDVPTALTGLLPLDLELDRRQGGKLSEFRQLPCRDA
jgi:hypothetical protein